jgi:hypothetical protein
VRWECDGHLREPGPTCKVPGDLPRRGFYKGWALLRILPPAIVLTLGPTHFKLEVAKRLHSAQWTTDKRGVSARLVAGLSFLQFSTSMAASLWGLRHTMASCLRCLYAPA